MVAVPGSVLQRYERFSLYNSPYPAHDRGCAIDLYPDGPVAPAPVAGTVLATRTVRCPSRPYAANEDHLIVIECDAWTARVLHVDPAVSVGDRVGIGDSLGRLVRSGYFARWVDPHLHLGFRPPDADPYRATGSLPVTVDVAVAASEWDGTGTVRETGPTHARLDAATSPAAGFASLGSDRGVPLDGGLPHYAGGGVLGDATGELSLLGTAIGRVGGRDVAWRDVSIRLETGDGRRFAATGLSMAATRDDGGVKLVFRDGHDLAVGDTVRVSIDPSDRSNSNRRRPDRTT